MRIAILEDDPEQAEQLRSWLSDAGHRCHPYQSARSIIHGFQRHEFDLLVLDWMLPESSGIEVLEWVRKTAEWPIPALILTARDAEQDTILALDRGADDFVTKPVSRPLLLARINALGRRLRSEEPHGVLDFGELQIDVDRGRIQRGGEPVALTERETRLAIKLFVNVGRLVSRDHLLESVWGLSPERIATRTVDSHVSRLRRKLGLTPEAGWQLKAVYQHGYRLERLDDDRSANSDA